MAWPPVFDAFPGRSHGVFHGGGVSALRGLRRETLGPPTQSPPLSRPSLHDALPGPGQLYRPPQSRHPPASDMVGPRSMQQPDLRPLRSSRCSSSNQIFQQARTTAPVRPRPTTNMAAHGHHQSPRKQRKKAIARY